MLRLLLRPPSRLLLELSTLLYSLMDKQNRPKVAGERPYTSLRTSDELDCRSRPVHCPFLNAAPDIPSTISGGAATSQGAKIEGFPPTRRQAGNPFANGTKTGGLPEIATMQQMPLCLIHINTPVGGRASKTSSASGSFQDSRLEDDVHEAATAFCPALPTVYVHRLYASDCPYRWSACCCCHCSRSRRRRRRRPSDIRGGSGSCCRGLDCPDPPGNTTDGRPSLDICR